MASVNKVILVGNLGRDPETRYTTGGDAVTNIRVATTDTWKDKNGEKQEKTEWHKCIVWNTKTTQLADIVERYLKKGDKVYVEGRIEYRQWQDKENQTRYVTEINVRELLMLSGRPGGAPADDGEGAARKPARSAAPAGGAAGSAGGDFEDFKGTLEEADDDLPF